MLLSADISPRHMTQPLQSKAKLHTEKVAFARKENKGTEIKKHSRVGQHFLEMLSLSARIIACTAGGMYVMFYFVAKMT